MLRFYEGSGSSQIELLDPSMAAPDWARLKAFVIRLLRTRNAEKAADFLESNPFEVYKGTNSFGDEFDLLYMKVPMDRYEELAKLERNSLARLHASAVVKALRDANRHVRFIAAELDTADGPLPVSSPTLATTSDIVERALADAERLLSSQGATSGVDRVHTAFHGYLRALADASALSYSPSDGITDLFRLLRRSHPALQATAPQNSEIDKILRSLANVVDALNPLRNHASVAHANSALLPEAEAMLVINSVRSLLHYLNAKSRNLT